MGAGIGEWENLVLDVPRCDSSNSVHADVVAHQNNLVACSFLHNLIRRLEALDLVLQLSSKESDDDDGEHGEVQSESFH